MVIVSSLLALPGAAALAETKQALNALTEAARKHRSRLNYDGTVFAGPALAKLKAAARESQFFLIGEEHGIAENPKLAAQLFATLVADGYEKLVIEVSPPMAAILDAATRADGVDGLRHLFASPGGEPAFFGMQEEAELLATARAALPEAAEVFWGVDYEVASDRPLLRQLQAFDRPADSDAPLSVLAAASDAAWTRYDDTGDPGYIFGFSGDPALVRAVENTWPGPDARAAWILDTLRSTLEINQLWVQGRAWQSNMHRAGLLRSNFLRHWRSATRDGGPPKVMVKLGGNHVVRGKNMTGTFDLGTLLPEIAASEGSRSVSVLVLPGPESMVAVLNPATWSYEPKPAKDRYALGLEGLVDAAFTDAFTLIDLAPLRPMVGAGNEKYGTPVARVVHGFDMLLVMSQSTPASELAHD